MLSHSRQTALGEALQRHADKGKSPAIAVAMVGKEGLLYGGAAGTVSPSSRIASTDTVFLTASISKTIVATLCLQSVERGELDLDEDINVYLDPECAVRNPNFSSTPISARHLLMHRSGLVDDESALCPGKWRTEDADHPVTLAEYVQRRLCPGSEEYEPWLWSTRHASGKAPWHYSNAGFALLGLVLECATGAGAGPVGGVERLARERIFEPLGMCRSTFSLAHARAQGWEVAVPQSAAGSGHYGVTEHPAAQLRSTASDLARYLAIFTTQLATPEGEQTLLTQESLSQLMPDAPRCEGGLAWWGADAAYGERSGRTWTHGGFMDGVRTHIYVWPRLHVGAVMLTNGEGAYKPIEFELKAALAEHLGVELSAM